MARRQVLFVFATGLLTGVVGMIVMMGGEEVPRAMAQDPAVAPLSAPGRFQVAAWAYPGAMGGVGAGSIPSSHGAYILDTQTGKAWQTKDGGALEPIGAAK